MAVPVPVPRSRNRFSVVLVPEPESWKRFLAVPVSGPESGKWFLAVPIPEPASRKWFLAVPVPEPPNKSSWTGSRFGPWSCYGSQLCGSGACLTRSAQAAPEPKKGSGSAALVYFLVASLLISKSGRSDLTGRPPGCSSKSSFNLLKLYLRQMLIHYYNFIYLDISLTDLSL